MRRHFTTFWVLLILICIVMEQRRMIQAQNDNPALVVPTCGTPPSPYPSTGRAPLIVDVNGNLCSGVTVTATVLTTGLASFSNQISGAQKTQIVDGSGNVIGSNGAGNGLTVSAVVNVPGSLSVSSTLGLPGSVAVTGAASNGTITTGSPVVEAGVSTDGKVRTQLMGTDGAADITFGGTAQPVTISGTPSVTVSSGTVIATQTTGTNLHAVIDSGTITATVSGTVPVTFAGSSQPVTVSSGTLTGVTTVGAVGTVNVVTAVTAITNALPAGSNTIGQVVGPAANGAIVSGNPDQVAGRDPNGNVRLVQTTLAGAVVVDLGSSTVPISGTVTANQGGAPWSNNITQIGSTAVVTCGTSGCMAMGAPVVTTVTSSAFGASVLTILAASSVILDDVDCYNADAAANAFVSIYNSVLPTIGTTAAQETLMVPFGGGVVKTNLHHLYANSVTAAATSSVGGSSNPSTKLICNFGYRR